MFNAVRLENFYNDEVKSEGLPTFSQLTEADKKGLADSFSFARYELKKAFEDFSAAFAQTINAAIINLKSKKQ